MTIYLEDDSVSISEPKVKNSGYPGKKIKYKLSV